MTDPQPSKVEKVKEHIKKEVEKIPPTSDQNLMAAMSYLWLISIIMLAVKRNDEFIQFHARQGVVLLIISAFGLIPVIGWIVWCLAILGMVIGLYHAWRGERYEIPFVFGWSEKLKF